MFDFLFLAPNFPFAVALAVLACVLVLEIGLTLIGHSGASPDLDIDVDTEFHLFGSPLAWIGFGTVPLTVFLILATASYATAGYALQNIIQSFGLPLIPAFLAGIYALPPGLLLTKLMVKMISRVMPRDHSNAVSTISLIGHQAQVTTGTATHDRPAEAKVIDRHGQAHYVRVLPASPLLILPPGAPVQLVESLGNGDFLAVLSETMAGQA